MAKTDVSDLVADYRAAGFGRTLAPGRRPALLLVDFAMAYRDPASPLFAGVDAECANAARLAAAARAAGIPCFFTRVEYLPGDPERDGGIFYRKVGALRCFDRGNPLGDYMPELTPQAGDREIVKQYPSAFFGTGFADDLRNDGIDTLVVTGLTTSGCVRASALDALCHGFVPLVVADACGDRDEAVQRANLFDLGAKYADIVSTEEVLAYFGSLGR